MGSSRLKVSDLALLVTNKWPLKIIRLQVHVASLNHARVAVRSLQGSIWSQLQSVDFDYNAEQNKDSKIAVSATRKLKTGIWQNLTCLSLLWMLEKEAASHLVQGNWRHIRTLVLIVWDEARPVLVQAHWPQLADLHLHTHARHLILPRDSHTAALCSLKNSSLPMLKKLHLSGPGSTLTAATLNAFSLASWHGLEEFVSECTEWDLSAINSLVNVDWPLLKGFSHVGRILSAQCL